MKPTAGRERNISGPEERTQETPGTSPGAPGAPGATPLDRGLPRPEAIVRVTEQLEARGDEVVELLKEVRGSHRAVLLPVYFRRRGEDFFALVETGPWEPPVVARALDTLSGLRNSGHAGTGLEIYAAHPVPKKVRFFSGRSPAALFQLRLRDRAPGATPEDLSGTFRETAGNFWETEPGYDLESLERSENFVTGMLDGKGDGRGSPPVLDDLVECLGCYLGEVIRHAAERSTNVPGSWKAAEGWGEAHVLELGGLELDPIGKARAFLEGGPEDSLAFYARYALEQQEANQA